jgi:hypothetical protein
MQVAVPESTTARTCCHALINCYLYHIRLDADNAVGGVDGAHVIVYSNMTVASLMYAEADQANMIKKL